jgi:hypothetical protein
MNLVLLAWSIASCLLLLPPVQGRAEIIDLRGSGLMDMPENAYFSWLQALKTDPDQRLDLTLTEPSDNATIPANAAAPIISWTSEAPTVLVKLTAGPVTIRAICVGSAWEPEARAWEKLRDAAKGRTIRIEVSPVAGEDGRSILPGAATNLNVDLHELRTPVAYLSLPVPFRTAKQNPSLAAWRLARVSDAGEPDTFMTNLPVCANCHAYSDDGSAMLLDMDVDGDKGGFVLADVRPEVVMDRGACRSWNTLPATAPSPFSFGLFARLSPDGGTAVATVGETSLFVMIDRDDYSQLFFPVTGQIGVYNRSNDTFAHLPGTTDPDYVHTGPSFSPDGREIAFSRARVNPGYVRAVLDKTIQRESSDTTVQALNARYPYRFDLCAVPFPNPGHDSPRPLPGASANGKSNYFPRYSPDGRWIVFTQAPTGLVLQPDSRLCIIPARGGEPHVLACNTARMNSWHCWSPDGRWLIFSGKGQGAETEIFLARMHEDGQSSASIRLHRLSLPNRACVVPEFLPGAAENLRRARLGFEQQIQINTQNNVR